MSIGRILAVALLGLGLAACGPGDQEDPAQSVQKTEAGDATSSDSETSAPARPDPEAIMESTDEHSRQVWTRIQEEHSELTEQQQRSLQACAELAIRDEDVPVDQAVEQCRQEMERMAEQQQEEGQSGDGETESGGN